MQRILSTIVTTLAVGLTACGLAAEVDLHSAEPHRPHAERMTRLPAVDARQAQLRQAWQRVSREVAAEEPGELLVRFQDPDEVPEPMRVTDEGDEGDEGDTGSAEGEAAFEQYCLDCHDAERSLNKSKSFSQWMSTIRRMAAKDDASIPSNQFETIARYLADVAGPGGDGGDGDGGDGEGGGGGGEISLQGTISAIWRSGNQGYIPPAPSGELQHPGFFPDVWVGLQWGNGPVAARATVCTSCHGQQAQSHFFELVEAAFTLDLMQAFACCYEGDITASIEAGRFVTPFGAYAGMSHPAAYRTVTNPLMYLMGRTVETGFFETPRPVLPHPYSDEGLRAKLSVPVGESHTATLDMYAVNGLQEGPPDRFFLNSRSYWDNNNDPAVGGRATFGSRNLRFGSSVMSGHLNNDRDPQQYYKLAGADVTWRHEDLLRAYFEYAIRTEETSPGARSHTYGTVVEGEVQVTPCVSMLARYDNLYARGAIVRGFGGRRPDDIDRFTWGINWTVPGGSELFFNHEIWRPEIGPQVDVVGLRWYLTF